MTEKLLLIKPPYEYYPVGLSYVASTLERHNIPYDFLDLSAPGADLPRHIRRGKYFAVGAGGLVADYFTLKNIFKQVKAVQPNIPCILGGLITKNVTAELIFKHMPIDVAVIGEAEITLPRLIEAMNGPEVDYCSVNSIKLGIGVESESDKILRNMCKGITAEKVRRFVPVEKQCGLTYFESGWMFNNETETQEDIEATLDFHEELDIRSGFSYTIPYPGTVIYKRARKKELITDEYQYLKTLPIYYTAEFIPDLLFLQTDPSHVPE